MANINGIIPKAVRTAKADDKTTLTMGSLYLGTKKIASFLQEIPLGAEASLQLTMMYGYSEKAFREELARLNGPDYGIEDLMEDYDWLTKVEKEFNDHSGNGACGMIDLNYEGGQIFMGIPGRLAGASDDQIIGELKNKIARDEMMYGRFGGFVIFRGEEDFCKGEPISLEAIRG